MTLSELLQQVQADDKNLYFSQEKPSVYGTYAPLILYVRDMMSHFKAFDAYKRLYYQPCDRTERDELVKLLTKHILQIGTDVSIPDFSKIKFLKYDKSAYSMALSAGNFDFPGFVYIKQKADAIKLYAAGHPLVNGKLNMFVSRVWCNSQFFMLSCESGTWRYPLKNIDLKDLFIESLCEALCKDYPALRFCITDKTVSEQNVVSLYELRDGLDFVVKQNMARDRVLSGLSRDLASIRLFLKHKDTDFSLLEFRDENGLVIGCYGAVFKVDGNIHFVPVAVFGDSLLREPLSMSLRQVVELNNKCLVLNNQTIPVVDFCITDADARISAVCRDLAVPAKTVILREHQDSLYKCLFLEYRQHRTFQDKSVSQPAMLQFKKSDIKGLMDIDTVN